ncbi:MAG: cytochrome C oxidase subunit IV family protein [Gemmatimonadetes bacterium]|nr:cytochrome C oxidase subunit IV family protein [Gemmatimonadota bacterium]
MTANVYGGSEAAVAHGERAHPRWQTYFLVAAVLAIITAAEVAVFYIEILRPALVPILLVLSGGKFALVVMFYMHLKFDSRIFTGVFVAPLLLAVLFVIIGLIVFFRVLPEHAGG